MDYRAEEKNPNWKLLIKITVHLFNKTICTIFCFWNKICLKLFCSERPQGVFGRTEEMDQTLVENI